MFACNRYLLLNETYLLVTTGYDFAENSRIPIDAYLDVVLIDLPWDPNFAIEGSNEHNDLVDVFKYQVCFWILSGMSNFVQVCVALQFSWLTFDFCISPARIINFFYFIRVTYFQIILRFHY